MNEFDLSYFMFAEQQILQQSAIMSNLSECVALESGDIESLRAISEGFIEKAKEVLHKIAEKIKEVFKKFTTRVSELVISDQKFLEKYKLWNFADFSILRTWAMSAENLLLLKARRTLRLK